MGNWFSKLFGRGGGAAEAPAADGPASEYRGFTIRPTLRQDGGQWVTAGVISKAFPEGVKEHRFIRVDRHAGRDEAVSFALFKARQLIDERGDRLFDGS